MPAQYQKGKAASSRRTPKLPLSQFGNPLTSGERIVFMQPMAALLSYEGIMQSYRLEYKKL